MLPSAPCFVLLALLSRRPAGADVHCKWNVDIKIFQDANVMTNIIQEQWPVADLHDLIQNLTDQEIDPLQKYGNYLAFPYYLQIDLDCGTKKNSMLFRRSAHFQGMKPFVTITFQKPVHAVFEKPDFLELQMTAIPLATNTKNCKSEICDIAWYLPLPYRNGSVRSEAHIRTNGIGFHIPDRKLLLNIDGYAKDTTAGSNGKLEVHEHIIGRQLKDISDMLLYPVYPQPLWFVNDVTPVLILGGMWDQKIILLSTTEFDTFTAVEVAVDSCWLSRLSCPEGDYSATIHDAIAMESMLFFRQNQLMYYFRGNYSLLPLVSGGSERWVRVMSNICVGRLIPVFHSQDIKEKIFIIGSGQHKAYLFLGTIKDGELTITTVTETRKICRHIKRDCSIIWASLDNLNDIIVILVEGVSFVKQGILYYLMHYSLKTKRCKLHFILPQFVPKEQRSFVIILGIEEYTDYPLVAKGIAVNAESSMSFLWGNFLFTSYNGINWLAIPNIPPTTVIDYFVSSWKGDFVFVADGKEVWYGVEGSPEVIRLRPSTSWNLYLSLQMLNKHHSYSTSESMLSIFFDRNKELQELVRVQYFNGTKIFKRRFPLNEILSHASFSTLFFSKETSGKKNYIEFIQRCPFTSMKFKNLYNLQKFNRMQHYRTQPPWTFSELGLYNELALQTYQGLIYQILWLHSTFYRSYADQIHDPTWRWWRNQLQNEYYYFYMASNKLTDYGFHVETFDYQKVYDLKPYGSLPHSVYLDMNASYEFSVYFSLKSTNILLEKYMNEVWLIALTSNPKYIHISLVRQEEFHRDTLVYQVKVQDRSLYVGQNLPGENLKSISVIFKVVNSELSCFHELGGTLLNQGKNSMKIFIGCPPGKRLAFDIFQTIKYMTQKNTQFFDCIYPKVDMPCFYYEYVFHPFFLTQDLVTGESDRFKGSYTFKIIGGGPYNVENIRYFYQDEIMNYNSILFRKEYAAIWKPFRAKSTDKYTDDGFYIFNGNSTQGIVWICERYSPCANVLGGFHSPEYILIIEVSNRGIDESTYCDYRLEFLLHLHGLPLGPFLGLHYMLITLAVIWCILLIFIIFRCFQIWFGERIKKSIAKIDPRIVPTTESDILYVHPTLNGFQGDDSSTSSTTTEHNSGLSKSGSKTGSPFTHYRLKTNPNSRKESV
uniref:Cation channel sperm-associated protein subunit gamma n=1 Tax=Callorhinchus milii TaxID=7868 RepID=V9K9C2_CALMI|eukprot:gi/632987007/ref/XP_007910555.1/ PREDICTED: cation channel sperm-associated protein subunit gamma [Callorhinchus milii]